MREEKKEKKGSRLCAHKKKNDKKGKSPRACTRSEEGERKKSPRSLAVGAGKKKGLGGGRERKRSVKADFEYLKEERKKGGDGECSSILLRGGWGGKPRSGDGREKEREEGGDRFPQEERKRRLERGVGARDLKGKKKEKKRERVCSRRRERERPRGGGISPWSGGGRGGCAAVRIEGAHSIPRRGGKRWENNTALMLEGKGEGGSPRRRTSGRREEKETHLDACQRHASNGAKEEGD